MADYIYLLQNRLTLAQGRALETVRDAARSRGVTVFLVGGAVRDLSSGTPVRDLDFAVQGDAETVIETLLSGGAVLAGRNEVLGAAYLTLPGGVRVEIGPTLGVSYPKPGVAETQPANILDDLRRRDFTANAMAISLNEGSYGLLLDPLNGIADIENRELRLVSNYGFIERPALLLRAARLAARLGWTIEERTASRYETAKEENSLAALPSADRGYELEEVFHEEDPLSTLEHMEAEGWRDVLVPAQLAAKADRNGMDAVRDLVGQMEALGIHPDPSIIYFPLITAKLAPAEVAALKAAFARTGFIDQIESAEARGKELAGQLTSKASASPSESWKLLFAAEPEVVLWLAHHSRSGAVQGKLKAFLREWPQMRQRIPYALMQEMRITPDLPNYDKLLDELFFALMDGKLETPEATRAFLEPYSPPAPPPQVSVRRRPAKTARGRSKKAADIAAASNAAGSEEEEIPTAKGDAGDDARSTTDRVSSAAAVKTADKEPPTKTTSGARESVPAQKARKEGATQGVQAPKPGTGTASPIEPTALVPEAAAKSVPVKSVRSSSPTKSGSPEVVNKPAAQSKSKAPVKRPAKVSSSPEKSASSKKIAATKKTAAKATAGAAARKSLAAAPKKSAGKAAPKKAAKKQAGKPSATKKTQAAKAKRPSKAPAKSGTKTAAKSKTKRR